jgi:uncharacterized protein (DUF302 family)
MVRLPEESATNTYLLDEPFAPALTRVRRAVKSADLVIRGELDLAARLRKAVLMSVPRCTILFVSLAELAPEDLARDPTSAALIPLHIVVSARGDWTEVHFLRTLPPIDAPSQHPGMPKLASLHAAISRTVERLGMRCLDA